MSFVGDFIGDVFGGITGAKQAGQAAERAGQQQAAMSQKGIEEQRRQFDKLVELLAPYRDAGAPALAQQQAFLGLAGQPAQQAAIQGIEQSPQFTSLIQQGENAILQNASATGGLRGGNVQGALAQFRPQLLNQLLDQQYSRLGGLTSLGQQSAAGQATAGMQTGVNIANLLGQQGAALAGGIMGKGGIARQTFGDLLAIGKTAASF
jgi:hypothetical protein